VNKVTPVSLGYPLSVFNKNSTLEQTNKRFSPSGFFYFTGDVSLQTGPPPPLEWLPFPPLVVAVLITSKGTESPGSGRIGVIGALVIFPPSEAV